MSIRISTPNTYINRILEELSYLAEQDSNDYEIDRLREIIDDLLEVLHPQEQRIMIRDDEKIVVWVDAQDGEPKVWVRPGITVETMSLGRVLALSEA